MLLDQSAAFYIIHHGKLLDCPSSWSGVGGVVLDWLQSYLSDCSQNVKIGSNLFDAKKLLFGVPHGLSLVQYSLPYILPSAKSFKIIPA